MIQKIGDIILYLPKKLNVETKVLGLNMLKIQYNISNISFIPQIFDSDVGSQLLENFSKNEPP